MGTQNTNEAYIDKSENNENPFDKYDILFTATTVDGKKSPFYTKKGKPISKELAKLILTFKPSDCLTPEMRNRLENIVSVSSTT